MGFAETILLAELFLLVLMLTPVVAGQWLYRRRKYAGALSAFRILYRMSRYFKPWRCAMAQNMCVCYIALNDFTQALPYAEEGVEETRKRYVTPRIRYRAQANLGIVLRAQGEYGQAETQFREVLAWPKLRGRLKLDVETHIAAIYLQQNWLEEAKRLLTEVLAASPEGSDRASIALLSLASCHLLQESPDEALKMATRAMAHRHQTPWLPALAQSHCLLYRVEMGDLEGAREIAAKLRPTLATQPPVLQAGIHRCLARLALERDELDVARDHAERAYPLDISPSAQAGALLIQAMVFAARGNRHRAGVLAEEILRLTPLEYYRRRAQALLPQSLPVVMPTTEAVVIASIETI